MQVLIRQLLDHVVLYQLNEVVDLLAFCQVLLGKRVEDDAAVYVNILGDAVVL